jgi:hypothetical protein
VVRLACLTTVFAADYLILRRSPRWITIGVVDVPAHLATAVLLRRPSKAYLLGSVLPDLDHVPLVGKDPQPGDPRPKTHSIYAPLLAGLVSPSLAAGIVAHFVRDLALPPGLPLLGGRHFRAPYPAYAVLLLATAYSRSRP